jgi:hypothetical protein
MVLNAGKYHHEENCETHRDSREGAQAKQLVESTGKGYYKTTYSRDDLIMSELIDVRKVFNIVQTPKTMVHSAEFEIVFKYFAPVRTWKPVEKC